MLGYIDVGAGLVNTVSHLLGVAFAIAWIFDDRQNLQSANHRQATHPLACVTTSQD